MATISEQLANVRTMEDVINLLIILFTNLNNQNELYYNMFLNPTPMDLTLERYDENGELVTVTIPNRAKDNVKTYAGEGNPNGQVSAIQGALYVDNISYSLYYKGYGSDSYGWILIYSTRNLDYLPVDGDASQLVNLNMNNVGIGALAVEHGGTGATSLIGLLKGNGESAFSEATDGIDYLGEESMVGMICFYPVYDTSLPNNGLPVGWLRCDGYDGYLKTEYPRLFAKIGTKYGSSSEDTFAVPDLTDTFPKGWDGIDVGVSTTDTVSTSTGGSDSVDIKSMTMVPMIKY